jgi:hypothetical protein
MTSPLQTASAARNPGAAFITSVTRVVKSRIERGISNYLAA